MKKLCIIILCLFFLISCNDKAVKKEDDYEKAEQFAQEVIAYMFDQDQLTQDFQEDINNITTWAYKPKLSPEANINVLNFSRSFWNQARAEEATFQAGPIHTELNFEREGQSGTVNPSTTLGYSFTIDLSLANEYGLDKVITLTGTINLVEADGQWLLDDFEVEGDAFTVDYFLQ